MTEDDAKTKWCPFVRFHIEGKAPSFSVAPNREQRGTRCIGTACMAWRLEDHVVRDGVVSVVIERYGPGSYRSRGLEDGEQLGGYCGLAGAPQ